MKPHPLAQPAASPRGSIPGGCDDCHAYQTVKKVTGRITQITVHHDNTCPALRARQNRRNTR
ncbi:hypothetical protein ACSDR0_04510 [Streptosporangium sp. G11]|uniref:hypothetical protein n=1 Tax=Streptosporangium sp. G11 TaxID=3436926 RepID=UPI003EBD02D2